MAKQRLSISIRRLVFQRAQGCCEYCKSQADFATQSFSIEHIFPIAKDGSNDPDNLALACQGCNAHKSAKIEATDPLTQQPVPIFHPRQHSWRDHFDWDETFTQVVGLTPVGRATVEELHLNRPQLVRLRMALFLLGEHPVGV
ncbi:MAG TPA: HNH endonuclease [Saprospiraceae bacterium]|nr:HNH endonuclease [Saprospiraceae bacterium]